MSRVCVLLGLALLMAACSPSEDDMRCDVEGRLGLLTVNILFNEIGKRDSRLESIADLAADHDVHVIFLQEVVGGLFAGTGSAAEDLRDMLADRGLRFAVRSGGHSGVPWFFEESNATLSRCKIISSRVHYLPRTPDPGAFDRLFGKAAALVAARIQIPGHGEIDTYNTHLCGRCNPLTQRARQLATMLDIIDANANGPVSRPAILAGDLNIDRFRRNASLLYDRITDSGFVDLYALHASAQDQPLSDLCESRAAPDRHCTIGVSGLGRAPPMRLDYIFAQGLDPPPGSSSVDAKVFFNPRTVPANGPPVSDHSAVHIRLELPPGR